MKWLPETKKCLFWRKARTRARPKKAGKWNDARTQDRKTAGKTAARDLIPLPITQRS